MKFPSRLSGFSWVSLLAVLCCSGELIWAQDSPPVNPLRRKATTQSGSSEARAPETRSAESSSPGTSKTIQQADAAVAEEPIVSGDVSRVMRARIRARRAVRPASYGLFGPQSDDTELATRQPAVARRVAQEVPIPVPNPQSEEIIIGGIPKELPGEMVLSDGWGDCCGGKGCSECVTFCCPNISFENLEVFGGVQGFTGPKNRGGTGSFGFDAGFNWGAPLFCSDGSLGMQFGLRSTFSNFSGAEFTSDQRNQLFLTGGVFRRVDWGLQGGLVVDYLSDRWYTDTDLVQLRGELSWVYPHAHEFGFWFAAHSESDAQLSVLSGNSSGFLETWEATDLYAFYYRKRICNATGRFYAGFSGESDGLIGGDLRLPLGNSWELASGFAYLVPEQARTGSSGGGHEHESWNVGINLVWYPGCRSDCDYFRPLLNVADNGSFMVDRR